MADDLKLNQIAILPTLPDGWAYHQIQERRDFNTGANHWHVVLYTPACPTRISASGDSQDLTKAIAESISKIPTQE